MEKHQIQRQSKVLFLLSWMAYSISYMGRLSFSACIGAIADDLSLSKAFLGSVGTVFMATYAVGQLVNGFIGDRVSPKYMVGVGLLGAGTANILMGFNDNPGLMLAIWMVNGWFHSMFWSPIIKALAEWMPEDRLSKAGANISTTIPVGTIMSYAIASLVLSLSSWRLVFIIGGIIMLLGGFVWFMGMAGLKDYIDYFEQTKKPKAVPDEPLESNPLTGLSFFPFLLRAGLSFAVAAILFNGVLKDGVTIWVPTFLSDFFAVSPAFSAAVSMIMPIVSLGGTYAAIYVNEKYIKNEMATTGLFFGLSALAILTLYLIGRLNIFVAVLMIALSLSGMLAVNAMLLTFIPFHFNRMGKAASVTGFLNACSYFASAFSSVSIGWIAEKKGWSMTILSWLLVALLGVLISFAGRRPWAKGRSFAAADSRD